MSINGTTTNEDTPNYKNFLEDISDDDELLPKQDSLAVDNQQHSLESKEMRNEELSNIGKDIAVKRDKKPNSQANAMNRNSLKNVVNNVAKDNDRKRIQPNKQLSGKTEDVKINAQELQELQQKERNEWRERKMKMEQEKLDNYQRQQNGKDSRKDNSRNDPSMREKTKRENPKESRQRVENASTTSETKMDDKSAKMFSLWQSNQKQPVPERKSSQGRKGNERTGKRQLGHHPTYQDLNSAVFNASNTFQPGDIVLVPRTRGGLNYAKIDKKVAHRHCFFDPSVEHNMILWKVIYMSNGKSLFKELPSAYIGKLPANLPDTLTAMEEEMTSEPKERNVGERPNMKDLENVVFSAQCSFSANEIVLVPRSVGGFTYGRLVKEHTQTCKVSDISHPLSGWRILVSEGEESSGNRKDLCSACIGKVCLISNNAAVPPVSRRQAFSNFVHSTHDSKLRMKKESEFLMEDASIATAKESEGAAEQREAGEQDQEELEEEEILWTGSPSNNPQSGSGEECTPESVAQGTPPEEEKAVPPESPQKASTVKKAVEPKENMKEEQVQQPVNLKQIGGIIAVDKTELLKKLMGSKGKSNKHLIVIDGPNVAKKHGKDTTFSGEGIQIALDYWNRRGHDAIAFLPQHYVTRKPGSGPVTLNEFLPKASNIPLLKELIDKGQLVLTPPQDYDDTYVIEYAMSHNGCIITNDRYWDHIEKQSEMGEKKKKEVKKWIRDHVISYTFVRDEFLPNPNFKFPPL